MLRPTWMLISALQHKSKYKSKFNFELFWKQIQVFGFSCCSTRENFSIDLSFTNVGLILTKLRRFQLVSKSQNWISNFFEKIKFLGFHAVVLVKTSPLMYQLLMYRTDIDEAMVISFHRGMDTRGTDRQTRFWNPHMETCLHT